MEKNGKGWKGAWQLDKWKWQVSNPQTNARTAVFILEDKNYLRTGFLEKRKQLCFPSLEWFFFNCKFLEKLKELDNNKHLYTCLPLCVCVCVCVLLAQSCPALSPPGSSVPGILQARILEWVAIPFSRGSS